MPEGMVPAYITSLIRHFEDLRDGTHGGSSNRADKEAHFGKAVQLLAPIARRVLTEMNTKLLLDTGKLIETGLLRTADGGLSASWSLSWPEQRAAGIEPRKPMRDRCCRITLVLFRRRARGELSGAEQRIGARVRKSRQKEAAGAADAGHMQIEWSEGEVLKLAGSFTAVTRVQFPLGNATILTALLQLPTNVVMLEWSSKIQKTPSRVALLNSASRL